MYFRWKAFVTPVRVPHEIYLKWSKQASGFLNCEQLDILKTWNERSGVSFYRPPDCLFKICWGEQGRKQWLLTTSQLRRTRFHSMPSSCATVWYTCKADVNIATFDMIRRLNHTTFLRSQQFLKTRCWHWCVGFFANRSSPLNNITFSNDMKRKKIH